MWVVKYMRVPPHQLIRNMRRDIIKRKAPLLFAYLGLEHDLKQQISQLFFKQFADVALNSCHLDLWAVIVFDLAIAVAKELGVVLSDVESLAVLPDEEV